MCCVLLIMISRFLFILCIWLRIIFLRECSFLVSNFLQGTDCIWDTVFHSVSSVKVKQAFASQSHLCISVPSPHPIPDCIQLLPVHYVPMHGISAPTRMHTSPFISGVLADISDYSHHSNDTCVLAFWTLLHCTSLSRWRTVLTCSLAIQLGGEVILGCGFASHGEGHKPIFPSCPITLPPSWPCLHCNAQEEHRCKEDTTLCVVGRLSR